MKNQSRVKKAITSALILLAAVVVIVLIAIGFGAIGVPLWPFILFLFFYTSVDNFDPAKLKGTAIGGLLGIIVGMSQGVVTQLSGSVVVGYVVFGVLALVLCTAFIMGDVVWSNVFGMLIMSILTLFSLEPCVWAGFPAQSDMGWLEAMLRVLGSYLIAVALFVVLVILMKKKKPDSGN